MEEKRKILFLTTEVPYPLDNGGKIRTFNMIKGLSSKFDIDLISFYEGRDDFKYKELDDVCSSVNMIKLLFTNSKSKKVLVKNVVKSFINNRPFIVEKFINREYEKKINDMISKNTYYSVIFDHLNITSYCKKMRNINSLKILSEHNCEYLILKRRYENEKSILKKLYLKYEYSKTEKYEKYMIKNFDKVIMLTEEDKQCISGKEIQDDKISIVPISVDTNYKKSNYNNEIKNLMFLGTMSWYPNEHGIIWFLNNVWPLIIKSNRKIKLYIVGKNPSDEIKKMSSDRVIVTGYVDDVNKYIEICNVCIVPLFIGGGMRVKILECMAKGIPVISTSIGAEGIKYTRNNEIVIADTPEEFVESIYKLNDKCFYNNIKINGIKLVNKIYSIDAVTNVILNENLNNKQ